MSITVGKFNGRIVQIVRVADQVQFSNTRGWIMVCIDWEQAERKKREFKWIPASTRFEWVKGFVSE